MTQVQVNRAGEPVIRTQEMQPGQPQSVSRQLERKSRRPCCAAGQVEQEPQRSTQEQQFSALILPAEGRIASNQGEMTDHPLNVVIGQKLVNWEQPPLGAVERVVQVNGTTYAVLATLSLD